MHRGIRIIAHTDCGAVSFGKNLSTSVHIAAYGEIGESSGLLSAVKAAIGKLEFRTPDIPCDPEQPDHRELMAAYIERHAALKKRILEHIEVGRVGIYNPFFVCDQGLYDYEAPDGMRARLTLQFEARDV